ncbi:hypothetical protein ACFLZW_04150 [Chloroflexota bacterium]
MTGQEKPPFGWKARFVAVLTHPNTVVALITALSLLVYLLLFVQKLPITDNYSQPRLDGVYTIRDRPYNQVRLLFAFLLLGGLYLAGWMAVRRVRGRFAWFLVLAGALACAIALLYMMPFDSADIFDNIVHGRILGVYGKNPFTVTASSFPQDPLYRYMAWKRSPSAYGPLWELLAGAAARLSGDGIITNILVFKLIPAVFWAGSLFLVGDILKRVAPQQALAGVYLLAFNPNMLFSTWGNGHNDIVMIFWILLSVWAIVNRLFTIAILSLVVGALIKYIPLLLLPAAGLIAWSQLHSARERQRFVILTAVCGLALVWFSYLPFWTGLETLTIERRAGLFTSSLPAVIYHFLSLFIDQKSAAWWVSLSAGSFTLIFTLCLAWRVRHKSGWAALPQTAFDTLAFYLLFTCLWFQQWYTLWLVGLAALLPTGGRQRFTVFFSLAALSKGMLFGPLLLWPKPKFSQPTLEILFTLGVLGLSWLYYFSIPKVRKLNSYSAGTLEIEA